MAIRITDELMSSDVTHHIAQLRPKSWGWEVTWLPGWLLTRSQAVTAMSIAEAAIAHADEITDMNSPWWRRIDGWADELNTTGALAIEAVRSPEQDTLDRIDNPEARPPVEGDQR